MPMLIQRSVRSVLTALLPAFCMSSLAVGAEMRMDVETGILNVPRFEAYFPDGEVSQGRALMQEIPGTGTFQVISPVERIEPITGVVADEDFPEDLGEVLAGIVASMVTDWAYPGVAIRVDVGGSSWRAAAGYSRLSDETPMDYTHRFRIASQSKTFTGQTMLQLVDQGVLSLDDTVAQWLPDLPLSNADQILLRHLLRHESGIYSYPNSLEFVLEATYNPLEVVPVEEWIAFAEAEGSNFAPGTDYSYSNTALLVAGLVIEEATGLPLREVIRQQIFDPLGLHDTSFPAGPNIDYGDFVHGYAHQFCDYDVAEEDCRCAYEDTPGICYDGIPEDTTYLDPFYSWASGAVISSLEDMSRFNQLRVDGELLSAATQADMLDILETGESTAPLSGEVLTRGVGLSLQMFAYNTPWLGHLGGIYGYSSATFYSPEADAAFVIVANRRGDYQFAELDGSISVAGDLVPELIVIIEDYLGTQPSTRSVVKRSGRAPSFGLHSAEDSYIPAR